MAELTLVSPSQRPIQPLVEGALQNERTADFPTPGPWQLTRLVLNPGRAILREVLVVPYDATSESDPDQGHHSPAAVPLSVHL
jgi:hypothetical protein